MARERPIRRWIDLPIHIVTLDEWIRDAHGDFTYIPSLTLPYGELGL